MKRQQQPQGGCGNRDIVCDGGPGNQIQILANANNIRELHAQANGHHHLQECDGGDDVDDLVDGHGRLSFGVFKPTTGLRGPIPRRGSASPDCTPAFLEQRTTSRLP